MADSMRCDLLKRKLVLNSVAYRRRRPLGVATISGAGVAAVATASSAMATRTEERVQLGIL